MESPSPAVEVRELSEGDLLALQEHMPSAHHPYRAATHESGAATFLLAWNDGKPVGYLLLKWAGADEEIVHRLIGNCPELNAITVAVEVRSRGIGTTLIAEAERRVRARGISRVGLAVGLDNPRARALYERLGFSAWKHGSFKVTWEAPGDPSGRESETCIYLVKPLFRENGISVTHSLATGPPALGKTAAEVG
jgi:GNAT superfamily N-acetyltransferase